MGGGGWLPTIEDEFLGVALEVLPLDGAEAGREAAVGQQPLDVGELAAGAARLGRRRRHHLLLGHLQRRLHAEGNRDGTPPRARSRLREPPGARTPCRERAPIPLSPSSGAAAQGPGGNMAAARPFRACSCFFSANIFVRRCGLHVRYRHREQLLSDYGTALRERGCGSPEVLEDVVREIEAEVQRRKQLIHQSAERKAIIASRYKRKHPEVYVLQVLLNEIGMDENFITPLREKYLRPITALLYPDLGGACLDSHKAFVVKYALHEDLDLSSHYDNAEVTLNVSLGKDFTEGGLYFGDFRQDPSPVPSYIEVEHVGTQGLLHRGGQIHGALPIASGERWNLIVWMRASAIRNRLCPMCNQKPELVEAEGFGDGFTESAEDDVPETVDLCSLW
ncbi:2-oxoglutarate and iron-dependent oxygenase domain-containing protein 2 isoform X3 [Anas acuta]|uniref:2-oxoglutarate and iron-dependent oxygenase domain-containing protein 2 isoform X3 n=1 Tax=Anas acuta TaxID=28680 RepID=UPI0035C8D3FE